MYVYVFTYWCNWLVAHVLLVNFPLVSYILVYCSINFFTTYFFCYDSFTGWLLCWVVTSTGLCNCSWNWCRGKSEWNLFNLPNLFVSRLYLLGDFLIVCVCRIYRVGLVLLGLSYYSLLFMDHTTLVVVWRLRIEGTIATRLCTLSSWWFFISYCLCLSISKDPIHILSIFFRAFTLNPENLRIKQKLSTKW